MNSSERRLARRMRRENHRNQRKSAFAEKYDNYENVIDANNLIKAAKLSRKGVAWKSSVQKYFMRSCQSVFADQTAPTYQACGSYKGQKQFAPLE